ncbi:MAG TPA: T9SS type A sorting domain-containing protein [Flavobacteriales bacterium]|nr:T9SS type A sorting domain-containing protein [Flavobacteriales bacterium]
MNRFFITLFALFGAIRSFGQVHEQLSPLNVNVELQKNNQKVYPGIFVYEVDTLSLPIQDDFSRSKFRKYNATPTDANVTDSVFYLLEQGGAPMPVGTTFMTDPTQYITFDTLPDGSDTLYFADLPYQVVTVYDLTQYPIVGMTDTVYPCYNIIDTAYLPTSPDTIGTTCDYTQDSVYVYFVASIDQTSAVWLDTYAYHNYRFGVNPPTLGVATFDGFDENGFPYDFTIPTSEGVGDVLTSKPINLGTHTPADSIYLSFFYQPEGYGESPEGEDSLILEVNYPALGSNTWAHVWSVPGTALQDFKQVLIPFTNPAWFTNGFRFRFKNRAVLSGSIDHWHLDYVYLNQFRSAVDTNRDDVAFRYQALTLLKNNYVSMPLTHYAMNPAGNMRDSISVLQRNNNVGGRLVGFNWMYLYHEGVLIDSVENPATPSIPGLTNFKTNFDVGLAGIVYDTALIDSCAEKWDIEFVHQTTPDECRSNDTMRFSQVFSNYYAYDDGSAESAYGPIGANSQLAYKFTLAKPDQLYGIAIHFSPNVNDVEGNTFFLTVWNDAGSGGTPGSILYQETVVSSVIYENAHNKFHVYPFSTPLNVSGNIYIGWKQAGLDKLNVGFDMNNNTQSKIYYEVGTGWLNTSFKGSLMMRPVFNNCETDYVSVQEEVSPVNAVSIYPNPANDVVNIKSAEPVEEVSLFDISGKYISMYTTNVFSVRDMAKGMYLVRVKTQLGVTSHRLVID